MEESDCRIVPMKQPNKEGSPLAEVAEGRRQLKENDAQSNTPPTQSGARVSQGFERRAPSGAGTEARAVHGFAASRDAQPASGEFRRIEEECGSWSGRRDVARV
jgi:hypothetical protein